MANSPSYNDVADQEDRWTMEEIVYLHEHGMATADIASKLDISMQTVTRQCRFFYENRKSRRYYTHRERLNQWKI